MLHRWRSGSFRLGQLPCPNFRNTIIFCVFVAASTVRGHWRRSTPSFIHIAVNSGFNIPYHTCSPFPFTATAMTVWTSTTVSLVRWNFANHTKLIIHSLCCLDVLDGVHCLASQFRYANMHSVLIIDLFTIHRQHSLLSITARVSLLSLDR